MYNYDNRDCAFSIPSCHILFHIVILILLSKRGYWEYNTQDCYAHYIHFIYLVPKPEYKISNFQRIRKVGNLSLEDPIFYLRRSEIRLLIKFMRKTHVFFLLYNKKIKSIKHW